MTVVFSRPSPAAIWVIRCLGVVPPVPNATMWEDWMLAPADVPATTAPRSCARRTASPTGVPQMTAESLSWFPPVMKTPLASSMTLTRSGSWASSRVSGRQAVTSPAPSRRNRASYTSTTSSARLEAVGITTTRASAPPEATTKSPRIVGLRSLSSAPPMIISGPGRDPDGESGRADGGCCSSATSGMTGKASRCQSAGVREQSARPSRRLVVMRHAKAEPGGETDHARELAQRGWEDALEAGRWLADRGLVPDAALVSSARRTVSTWLAVAEGGSFESRATHSEGLHHAGPETALDLVRETADEVRTLVVIGHNPTIAYLAQLLDDGTGDDQ